MTIKCFFFFVKKVDKQDHAIFLLNYFSLWNDLCRRSRSLLCIILVDVLSFGVLLARVAIRYKLQTEFLISFNECVTIESWKQTLFALSKVYDRTILKLGSLLHGQIGWKLRFCYVKSHVSFLMQNLV